MNQLLARKAITAGLLMAAAMGASLPVGQRCLTRALQRVGASCGRGYGHQSNKATRGEVGESGGIGGVGAGSSSSSSTRSVSLLPSAVFWVLLALEIGGVVIPFIENQLDRNPVGWLFAYLVRRVVAMGG
jgi:hypothetical protein